MTLPSPVSSGAAMGQHVSMTFTACTPPAVCVKAHGTKHFLFTLKLPLYIYWVLGAEGERREGRVGKRRKRRSGKKGGKRREKGRKEGEKGGNETRK